MVQYTAIFLHGWGGSKKSLEPLSNSVQSYHITHSFVLEMPGHGNTKEMEKPWNMEDFANWAKSEIDQIQLQTNSKNVLLVGHSFGGKILLKMHQLGLIDNSTTLVLVNISGIKPNLSLKNKSIKALASRFKFIKNHTPKKLVSLFYKFVLREHDYVKTSGNLKESFRIIIDEHFDLYIPNIKNNCLIIWGKNDSQTPIQMGEILHKSLPNSKFISIEGTHGLPLYKPKELSIFINEFLKEINQ